MPAEGQSIELSRFSWESTRQKIVRHSDCVEDSLQPIATEDQGGVSEVYQKGPLVIKVWGAKSQKTLWGLWKDEGPSD